MAKWITHLRVAEQIAQAIPQLSNEWFYYGNVAADSGRYTASLTFPHTPRYIPPTQVTHWSLTHLKRRGHAQPDAFYNMFLRPLSDPFDFEDRKTAFYWGYFAHLITDINWVESVILPQKEAFRADKLQDSEKADAISKRIPGEWDDIDSLYLKAHPGFKPLEGIRHMAPIQNDLLPYFDETAMEEKRQEFLKFYDEYKPCPEENLRYTRPSDIERVIQLTVKEFLERLADKRFQAEHRAIRDITDYIFVSDMPSKSDIIFIPGTSSHQSGEMAALLYQEGLAFYILPSGRYSLALGRFAHEKVAKEQYKGDFETEFEYIHNILRIQGVPEDAILKEDRSMHTMENAEFSAAVVKAAGIRVKRAIICCKAYHARRALMAYSCHFPGVEFYVVPLDIDGLSSYNWYQTEANYRKVLSELKKCGTYFQDYRQALASTGSCDCSPQK